MQDLKTRKQGNSVTVTIPKEFGIKAEVTVRPKKTEYGFSYEVVDQDTFFDFSSDILAGVIKDGFRGKDILTEFNKRKGQVERILNNLGDTIPTDDYSEEQVRQKFGL
ncbi:AbrB family transcriptional regulator [Levilactobacillus namurensis]|uniref:hypothetical protein n=1 Tax=Levilactobacillus namurensis TaxID=380393 RepID=UPI00070527F4|nr:hypothetical protein [Levilactobacillus namurensis]GEO75455.1 AbrB family transcriptional regulator [Levilactobacillus namurensis]